MADLDLTPPGKHKLPPLLVKFSEWLDGQHWPLGAVEWELNEASWDEKSNDRLSRDGFSFLSTGDDSHIILLNTGKKSPAAVCLLGSEGATRTIANSLEEFLFLLADGSTGVMDLDDEDATGRGKLKAWLKKNKVTVPKAADFDFDDYLSGGDGSPKAAPPPKIKVKMTPEISALHPKLQKIAMLMGRRGDDPELVAFITDELGKKPAPFTSGSDTKHVVAKKQGLEFAFDHEVRNNKYPVIVRSTGSYVPYLTLAWLGKPMADALPFGLKFGMDDKELEATLGDPADFEDEILKWRRVLDAERDIVFEAKSNHTIIRVFQGWAMTHGGYPKGRLESGVIVAWLITRGLINAEKFPEHQALYEAVRSREKKGTDFYDAALPKELWDIHLMGGRKLARTVLNMHMDGRFSADLMKVLGLYHVDLSKYTDGKQLKKDMDYVEVTVTLKGSKKRIRGTLDSAETDAYKTKDGHTNQALFVTINTPTKTGYNDTRIAAPEIESFVLHEARMDDDDWDTVEGLGKIWDKRHAEFIDPKRVSKHGK